MKNKRDKKNGIIKETMLVPIEKEQKKDIIGKRKRENYWKGKANINPNTMDNAKFIILYTTKLFFFYWLFLRYCGSWPNATLLELARCYGVSGLKESATKVNIMTQLATHIHPNDSAFEELVRGTWSRTEGPSLQRKKDFKSDLGDDVDQDVLEFIDEDEKKEFDMVKTAAKRRIQLAKQNVNDELVEARAKFAPKKKPNAKPKAKAQNQQGSKRKKSEKKESTTRTNKKRKLTGAEIAKRAKRLAIVDEVPNEPVDAMQIVLLEPEQSNHTAVVPPEQPAQVSQPQGVVPNSNEQSKDPVFPEQPAQGTVPKETVPTSASAIDDSMSLYDLLYDSTERASSSTSRPPPAERASSSGSRPPPECASGPPPTSRNDESSKAGKAPELREKRANTTTASGKRGPIADRKEPIQWTTVKCEKCKKDAGQWKYDPSPGQRDAATYYYRVHETDKKHSALASLAKVFEELIWNRQGKFCLKD